MRSWTRNSLFLVTIQSHAKLLSANACIQAEKQFYMANVVLNSYYFFKKEKKPSF